MVDRVLAIGLDGVEISLVRQMMAEGELPALRAMEEQSAAWLLEHWSAHLTGLSWEHFWSGLSPEDADRASAVEFDASSYSVWQEGARFAPFFDHVDGSVVLDAPYGDFTKAREARGVLAWATHDPGLAMSQARPAELEDELRVHVGPHPASGWLYATPWPSADATRTMADVLVGGIDARAKAARWLLADRLRDWKLGVIVVSEPHAASEAMWHGVDPTHPLHAHPAASAARDGLRAVLAAVDRFVGDVVDGTRPDAVVVFNMGGMGTNDADIPSMVLLPELVFRWAFDDRLLDPPAEWQANPSSPPILAGPKAAWSTDWYPRVNNPRENRSLAQELVARLPAPVRDRIRNERAQRRVRARPTGYLDIAWQPAAWYRPWWPQMRAFALPSLYDGRIRVNLRGRERDGIVEPEQYESVCDEIEALVTPLRDSATGELAVARVTRNRRGDPFALHGDEADVSVTWQGSAFGLLHPEHGLLGPVPYRRTGGHTGPHGFAWISAPGLAPGGRGVTAASDVAPTILDLLGAPSPRISGTSLLS